MNRYFLVIACLQLVRDITPVNPLTTWLPLAVIFAVTAVKEAIDDVGRARADKIANSRVFTVLRASATGGSTRLQARDRAIVGPCNVPPPPTPRSPHTCIVAGGLPRHPSG